MKVTVAVLAYKSQKSIKRLVSSLINQSIIKDLDAQIIVHCDASGDNTYKIAKKVKHKNLHVIGSSKRLGFAGSIKLVFEKYSDSDYLVFLNDDILIKDKNFLKHLLSAADSDNVGLACASIQPVAPVGFVQRAITSSQTAYRKMATNYKEGNNKFTCDGKVLLLTERFIKNFKFPSDLSAMGNVDIYFYFSCLKMRLKYKFAKNAICYYKNPQTVKEYFSWFTRNNSGKYLMKKSFGKRVETEYKPPTSIVYYKLLEAVKNPLGSVFIFVTSFIIRKQAKEKSENFNHLWQSLETTK